MTSLSSVYEGGVGSVVGRKRRLAGAALFTLGAALVVGSIPLATTDLASWLGLSVLEARQAAGITAGLGLPAVLIGIFTVLPASGATRGAAAIGASLAVLGVALFAYAYPQRWVSAEPQFAVLTMVVYSLGALVTVWCLFVAVATFKTRNDPGGTARVELTEEGTVRIISVESSLPSFGSVGLFGSGPDGDIETQTNDDPDDEMVVPEATVSETTPQATSSATDTRRDRSADDGWQSRDANASRSAHPANPTSDGGTAVAGGEGERTQIPATPGRGTPDRYCGNCRHFEYVRADGEITPYCGLTQTLMEDMDACEDWHPNS
ncbi:MAG: hypothetical protein V5A55_10525 [Halovenus sp.]